MSKLTYDRLHKLLNYNQLTGIFVWKVSKSNRVSIGDVAGCRNDRGYVNICIDGKKHLAHRLAWFYVYGYLPENRIDHKDRICHHNWILNLREASNQCNIRNTGNFNNNTSGVKGVYWNKGRKKWHVHIGVNQKVNYLGLYKDFNEAVCHRLAAEQCLGWPSCDSNSPAFKYVNKYILK